MAAPAPTLRRVVPAWRGEEIEVPNEPQAVIAEVVGREDEAVDVQADYDAFVDDLPEGLDDTTVALIHPSGDGGFRIDSLPSAFPGSVADGADVPLLLPEGVGDLDEGSGSLQLSGEHLPVLEQADLLVVADFAASGDDDEDGVTQLATNPVWDQLTPVQEDRVLQVPGLVHNGGDHDAAQALLTALAGEIG
jgi:ABC-type Fe3+-hydroxamate transport system substrate-binding protein